MKNDLNELKTINLKGSRIIKASIEDENSIFLLDHIVVKSKDIMADEVKPYFTSHATLTAKSAKITYCEFPEADKHERGGSVEELREILEGSRVCYYETLNEDKIYLFLVNEQSLANYRVFIQANRFNVEYGELIGEPIQKIEWYDEDNLVKQLSYIRPPSVQEAARKQLLSVIEEEMHRLIQPYGKEIWGIAAEILYEIGYPRIMAVAQGLLEWLMDMNWPGAVTVAKLLKTIPKEELAEEIDKAIDKGIETDDGTWLGWLYYLISEAHLNAIMKEKICRKPKRIIMRYMLLLTSGNIRNMTEDDFKSIKRAAEASDCEIKREYSSWLLEIAEQAGITQEVLREI